MYQERKERDIEEFKKHFKTIRTFKEIRATTWGLSIGSMYSRLGGLCLHLNEINESKAYYAKAGLFIKTLFEVFENNRFPNLKKTESLPFTALFNTSFIDVILSGNDDLLKNYSATINYKGNDGPSFNYDLTYAMKYLILDDRQKSLDHAKKAHQSKYFKLPYNGFSHVILGILEKDDSLINEGIQLRLKYHLKNEKTSIFFETSFDATALVRLARLYGFKPEINSFIHERLIENNSSTSPIGIDEILDSLEYANSKNGGLFQQAGTWFK